MELSLPYQKAYTLYFFLSGYIMAYYECVDKVFLLILFCLTLHCYVYQDYDLEA